MNCVVWTHIVGRAGADDLLDHGGHLISNLLFLTVFQSDIYHYKTYLHTDAYL